MTTFSGMDLADMDRVLEARLSEPIDLESTDLDSYQRRVKTSIE
jgi:hypothetical protein